jgi:formylglycine-generating enzyme required for sulfatase activity
VPDWRSAPSLSTLGEVSFEAGGAQRPALAGDPWHELTLPPELDVGQFRVRRLLGEGGMGRVYLARDQVLGRLVALKIVRADRLGADGAERFLEEARLTARFAHPHIVTIFEVGRFRGVPFLALEYLDGESLHTRLRREQPSTDEALRIVRAVADAVAHAHARGVRHGDLKPGNVMLPSDGRLRVVDFGLAVELRQDAAARRAGTLTYMAPEYWQGGAVGDRADVWALATLLAECLLGRPPSPRLPAPWARTSDAGRARGSDARVWAPDDPAGAWTTRAELAACERLSPALREVLGRALDDAPEARPTAAELYQALDHELARTRVAAGVQDSPFRGLLPFEARHAQAFFGREVELEAFLTRLRGEPALYVVGPSGVGKSSFVHAGVLARLAAREPWVVVTVRPGVTPVRTLAASLVRAGQQGPESVEVELDAVEAVAARLRAHPATLAVELAELGRRRGGRVVLVVDQLEELFTHGASAADREVYLAAVSSAAEDALEPTRVIVTVRDDFVGRVPGVRAIFALHPLSRAALASTVLEPLRQVGYEPDDAALVSRMVDALDEAPGQLPLLQFVCRLLWESRDAGRRVVLSRVYEQMGGVAGALASHGDAVLAELDDTLLTSARRLLVSLVTVEGTRRVRALDELEAELGPVVGTVVTRLAEARLLVVSRARDTGTRYVELAHEALISRWRRLARWLDEARDEQRLLQELGVAAELWARRGRREDETWTGEALAVARHRLVQLGVQPRGDVALFLAVGERRAQAQLTRRRRLRLAVAVGLALTTLGALVLAAEFRRREVEVAQQNQELRRASANLGEVTVTVTLFDWDPGARGVRPSAETAGGPRLHEVSADDPTRPGPPLPADLAQIRTTTSPATFVIEAPGGAAFLAVTERGPGGCAPAWIRLRALPGYADRRAGGPHRLALAVPSCQASRADGVRVPAGPFVLGGADDVAALRADGLMPERTLDLPAFDMDRHELSNTLFAPLAALSPATGLDVPRYPDVDGLLDLARPDHPVTGLSARDAALVCLYYGKRLPRLEEWVKAARGGLQLPGGAANTRPRRALPGGDGLGDVNLAGEADGCATTCAVTRPSAPSPYGIVALVGNAAEWLAPEGSLADGRQPLAGGGWATDAASQVHTTAFATYLEARYFDFQTGVRCVADVDTRD